MKLEDVQARLELLRRATEGIKIEVKEYCQDTSKPLEDRWNLFINSGLGDHSNYIEEFDSEIIKWFLDTDCYQRHETIYVKRIIEIYCDNNDIEDINDLDVIKLKENILKQFIKSFDLDW